jgi:hypothetical protein
MTPKKRYDNKFFLPMSFTAVFGFRIRDPGSATLRKRHLKTKIPFSSPVPDEEEEEDPWEDKTAEITFGGGQTAVTGLTKVRPMDEI